MTEEQILSLPLCEETLCGILQFERIPYTHGIRYVWPENRDIYLIRECASNGGDNWILRKTIEISGERKRELTEAEGLKTISDLLKAVNPPQKEEIVLGLN